jgi:hypothetical protein
MEFPWDSLDFHGISMGFPIFPWDFHEISSIFILLQIHIFIIYYILVYLSKMFKISSQPYYVL